MKPGRNLLAGLANSIWTALVGLVAVPFYLKYLGVEAYGLIGFFATTQALLQLLDMGMAPTINREVARCSAAGDISGAGKLLHTFAVIYWGMAAAIAGALLVLAPLIADYWLRSRQLAPETVAHAVMLMGLVVACRWPTGLYQNALIGAQRLTVSSAINMTMVTLGSLGAVAILAFLSPTIEAFFVWQACMGLVLALAMRAAAWKIVGGSGSHRFDFGHARHVLGFSLGVGAISLAGLVLTQLDKVILSKTLELADFGRYMFATTAAGSLYVLITPAFNIVYPRFSAAVASQSAEALLAQYRSAGQLLATLLFPATMALAVLAQPLIALWTGNAGLASEVAPLVTLLLAAYALHGVMHIPYALMLAKGETRSMFSIYIALIAIITPLTAVMSLSYGSVGGAFAQFLLFVLYLVIGTWVIHRKCLKGHVIGLALKDIGIPLGISFLAGIAGYAILPTLRGQRPLELLMGAALWMMATLSCICASQYSRALFMGYWKQLRYRQMPGR